VRLGEGLISEEWTGGRTRRRRDGAIGSRSGERGVSDDDDAATWKRDNTMEIIKLSWVGTRTQNAEPTVRFFRDVLGLRLEVEHQGFWMLKLPDGGKVEVFGPESPVNQHFTTGPVAGFLVDDVFSATAELRSAGVEILLEPQTDDSGNGWVHFRAPDGNIYELTQDPGVSRPH
jgi:catechol 2,3-dioxygenase-like lactoylglutathione lyase family enzyme